jgi:hypothetical protein
MTLGLSPPRLPDPPTDFITKDYLQDLIRALELYIAQQETLISVNTEEADAMNWFF